MENALKQFIKPSKKKGLPSITLVNYFIDAFNKKLVRGVYSLNTGLDKISELDEANFEMAKNRAEEIGFILTKHEDNYQTTSYRLTKK